jgi:hypothetical protein
MNFQTMCKQRKFVLISAAVGFISMFLPWISLSMMGYSQSVNGMHDKGILIFLCFVASGVISYLGDQTTNLDKTMWSVTLLAGAIALLFTIWYYSEASNSILGSSFIGFGVYIAAIASIGILVSAYMFRSPTDNLKDGFNSMKKDIESKIGNTPPPSPPPSNKPPAQDVENSNPPV